MATQFSATFHPPRRSSRPQPAVTYSMPSSYDGTPIDGRIYHPLSPTPDTKDEKDLRSELGRKVAVVAHPYAPLGGSWDDPVVMTVVKALLGKGFVVGTFNFR